MKTTFLDWSSWTPETASKELETLLEAAEAELRVFEALRPMTYEAFAYAGTAIRDLYECWGKVSHMLGVMNDEAWRAVEAKYQPALVRFSLRAGQSKPIYESAKRVLAADKTLNATRRRILEKTVEGAERAGVGLEGEKKARFNEIQERLAKLSMDFSNAVIDATKAFSFEKDGKTYTIDDAAYPETMKHCVDREVRERLYRARATRAPENAARIDEMLALRQELSQILGYVDFAHLSLATKCAATPEAVFAMIDELDAATAQPAREEDHELGENLAPWDRAFAAERLRERKYAYSEEELKRCFELEDVLKGLFTLSKTLFGIVVREMTGDEKPSVWHPDVRVFAVEEKGEAIAHFYFDPFVRNGQKHGGAWMNEFRNRRPVVQFCDGKVEWPEGAGLFETPLALVATNFPKPDAEGRCLLPFREVETLFHEFGHALQQMLTRVDEDGAAGINLVEWDAVEVASQFMENWCLDGRTGIRVPADLKAKVLAAKNFRAASACRRQLAFAKTDLLLHLKDFAASHETPNDLKRRVFAHFDFPMVDEDIFLCAFTHIFSGGYAAGYYGYKWSEVMSADCYGAFEEAGLQDDAKMKELGARYRETILALGGSRSALDVFRLFRGRDPNSAALLRQQGLTGDSK